MDRTLKILAAAFFLALLYAAYFLSGIYGPLLVVLIISAISILRRFPSVYTAFSVLFVAGIMLFLVIGYTELTTKQWVILAMIYGALLVTEVSVRARKWVQDRRRMRVMHSNAGPHTQGHKGPYSPSKTFWN